MIRLFIVSLISLLSTVGCHQGEQPAKSATAASRAGEKNETNNLPERSGSIPFSDAVFGNPELKEKLTELAKNHTQLKVFLKFPEALKTYVIKKSSSTKELMVNDLSLEVIVEDSVPLQSHLILAKRDDGDFDVYFKLKNDDVAQDLQILAKDFEEYMQKKFQHFAIFFPHGYRKQTDGAGDFIVR